jgi:hypothetical protein
MIRQFTLPDTVVKKSIYVIIMYEEVFYHPAYIDYHCRRSLYVWLGAIFCSSGEIRRD